METGTETETGTKRMTISNMLLRAPRLNVSEGVFTNLIFAHLRFQMNKNAPMSKKDL